MTSNDLSDRLWDFTARVGKVVDALPDTRLGRHVAEQLVRCGTSAAPNHGEGCTGGSRADFIHKPNIALKKPRESRGWLRFTSKEELLPSAKVATVLDESEQLARILAKSILTAKTNRTTARPPI